jgi:hypothetical protein
MLLKRLKSVASILSTTRFFVDNFVFNLSLIINIPKFYKTITINHYIFITFIKLLNV